MSIVYLYKLVGSSLIAASAFFIWSEYSKSVRRALSAARDAERLVSYIGECIAYRQDTIGEIILSFSSAFEPSRRVWEAAAKTSLSEALSTEDVPFDGETLRLLSDFSSSLGRGYREPQTELCRVFSLRLREHIRTLEASEKDRLRVGAAVCVFVCLSLIILLI